MPLTGPHIHSRYHQSLYATYHIGSGLRQATAPSPEVAQMLTQLWSGSPGLGHSRDVGNQRSCYGVLSLARRKVKDTAVLLLEINF